MKAIFDKKCPPERLTPFSRAGKKVTAIILLPVAALLLYGLYTYVFYTCCAPSPQKNGAVRPVDADSLAEKGKIAVGFNKEITQSEAEELLKKYGLVFLMTDNVNQGQKFFYESGAKFIVTVPEGQEQSWINELRKLPQVYGANRYFDPDEGPLLD